TQPPMCSVASTPPSRGEPSKRTYSNGIPEHRFRSSAKAALRPEIPPPMMAMRFMDLGGAASTELVPSPRFTQRSRAGLRNVALPGCAQPALQNVPPRLQVLQLLSKLTSPRLLVPAKRMSSAHERIARSCPVRDCARSARAAIRVGES